MKRFIFILTLLFFSASAWAGAPELLSGSIRHEGRERQYSVYVSKKFERNNKTALVIALHGGGGTGKKFLRMDYGHLVEAADRYNMVLVFPEGVNRSWNDGRKEIFRPGEEPPDDVGFISALIDRFQKEYGLDPAKVFATGISNGGHMSIRLALELSDKIKGAAPVAAPLPRVHEDQYPKHSIPLLFIEGTEDPLVPYEGGDIRVAPFARSRGEVLSAKETLTHFARHYGCGREPAVTAMEDADTSDSTTSRRFAYQNCSNGIKLELIEVNGGGHTWPGGMQYLPERIIGRTSNDFDASDVIVRFFMEK